MEESNHSSELCACAGSCRRHSEVGLPGGEVGHFIFELVTERRESQRVNITFHRSGIVSPGVNTAMRAACERYVQVVVTVEDTITLTKTRDALKVDACLGGRMIYFRGLFPFIT